MSNPKAENNRAHTSTNGVQADALRVNRSMFFSLIELALPGLAVALLSKSKATRIRDTEG
jgi:hypothetical protein